MPNIAIVGAGFAGLSAALGLAKRKDLPPNCQITLFDRHNYHLFTPGLYQAAASEEEFSSISQISQRLAVPLPSLISRVGRGRGGPTLRFVQTQIERIDLQRRRLTAGVRQIDYDFLVLAAGGAPEFFGIRGAANYGLPLKTLGDAFRIRNRVEFAVQRHRLDAFKPAVRLVVVGGGYSGVELAGELARLSDIVAWKNGYPRSKIDIELVESGNRLVPGGNSGMSGKVARRLADLGVQVRLLAPVFQVHDHEVELLTGERVAYDVLVWTAGTRGAPLPAQPPLPAATKGRLAVDEFLRVRGQDRVFVAGELADLANPSDRSFQASAQAALAQGSYLAASLPIWLKHKTPPAFRPTAAADLLCVGGRWAAVSWGKFSLSGRLAYFLRPVANWRYFSGILGWRRALGLAFRQDRMLSFND